MEKQKLIYVESKALFSPSEVSDKAIVFIKDTKEIWTHGVYFSCSGTWATPITLSLTGDTTGSVSIDGSGNASIATTTNYLSGNISITDANNAANTQQHKIAYYARIGRDASNLFPAGNNANGILSLNVHDYSYTHLLGFSSDGNIYHRRRNGGTWETSWKTILSSSNYTNFHHTFASLTNKPTTLSGYGITDCIPIISGGKVTTDTDLSTLGMTTLGAKLSVFHLYEGPYPTWLNVPYMNVLMFRSTSDSYGAIGIEMTGRTVLFIGGRNVETGTNNTPNWWFRIKGNSGSTYDLNSILNSISNLDSNYLKKSGGTMTGILTLTTDSAYISDTISGSAIFGTVSTSNTFTGISGLETVFAGRLTNMVLRTSGDNLYHYNHSKSARYLILDTNNYSTYALPLSGGTMTGALNFANNTWNKVGDDAYMGDCNVAGMIGIKGSNAATPGFAMYNNSGTLLGKLYASGTSLYWSDAKILTASGTSKLFVMGDGSLYSDTVSHNTWTKTTTSGIAWFPIADITDLDLGTALFMVRAYAHSSIIFTVVRGLTNGNINVLAGGGNFNNDYAYIRGVRLIGNVVEIGLNAAATYVKVAIRVLLPTFTYSLRSSLVESTSTTTPYVQYDINSGGNHNFGIISSKFTGNLIGNADTASNISTINPILALPFEKNTIQVVSNPLGALAELLGAGAAITHALRFNWYNTAYEIGNVRGGESNSLGFGVTYGNNNLCLLVKTNGTYSPYGFIGDLTGNAASANKWAIARTITLTGDVTGSVTLDGSSNVTLTTATAGTGTTTFLKCPDKRDSYPALIVTSGGNIGAAFISTSTLGLSEGYYCDTLILRGYATHTAGYENALLFNKQNSSVYHSQYAFGSTTTWGTIHKFLDSNNYSSYALPLSGGTMTGKLTMLSNSLANLPQIYRTDGAYLSGIRFLNTLGYLGAIGMDAVSGSLRIIDAANATHTVLDSRNYTNYTINHTKSGINNTGFVGVINGNNLYHHSELSFARFSPTDGGGNNSYELIAELTNYNTGANTGYINYGISGFMWSYRGGNCNNSSAYPITAIVSIGPYTNSRIRVPVTTNVLVPFIVKYNNKYYLALRLQSSSTAFYFMGQKLNLLTTTIKVNDASLIEEIKGPEVETSTSKYYYNNGTPQEYLHAGNYNYYALPLAGGTLTGILKSTLTAGSLGTSPIVCTGNVASTAEINNTYSHLASNLATGGVLLIFIGKASSLYNGGSIGYWHKGGDGNSSNALTFGLYSADNLMVILGNGNVGINNTSPSYKLDVGGDIYSSGYIRAKSGFIKTDSSDSYVLLGGGGHKLLSDFVLTSSLNNYVTLSTNLTVSGKKLFNNQLIIRKDVGDTDSKVIDIQHDLQLQVRRDSNTHSVAIGVMPTGAGVIWAKANGIGYNTLYLNPYNNGVAIGCGGNGALPNLNDGYYFHIFGSTLSNNSITATKFIKSGGTSSLFLKADGSLDSTSYLKVDGTNGTADGVSTLLNKLTTGSSTPVDTDYYICQYAGGGTTTTSYHRRQMSAMYAYIKSKATSDFLPIGGGTLGSSTASFTDLFIKSSTAKLRLISFTDSTTYIQSGNSDFTGNATLKITGYNSNTGSNLYFNFANIYCRGNNYTNIDSGNYSSYALPLSGGTLTGTLISRDIRPSANVSYSLGTSSYYYNYVYGKYFVKNGSSDSYVLLGGGGHKAVSDFAPNNVATLSSSGMGNSDLWTLVFEQSYPASHWYEPIAMFYVKGGTVGCGILCFYNYWNSATKLNAYEKEVWFFGAGKSETSATFGGTNRDINDYLRIYIDTANFKYYIYYNRYNDRDVKILELLFFESPDPLHSSFFTNSTTVVNLPTESSTLVRVPIKTTYNHDRTIKTSKSIYASSFYENSDIRLKENIQRIDLSDLTKLVDLVQFNFKDSDTKKYGVIAQLLELVGLQNLVYENDGKKAVDYISLLVLEIQRLRNEIGELKLEINKKS